MAEFFVPVLTSSSQTTWGQSLVCLPEVSETSTYNVHCEYLQLITKMLLMVGKNELSSHGDGKTHVSNSTYKLNMHDEEPTIVNQHVDTADSVSLTLQSDI